MRELMPRDARKRSGSDFYHIICKGSSKQIIFENDEDRALFRERRSSLLSSYEGTLIS